MRVDKHFDPVTDLERELLQELDDIAKQLRGKITIVIMEIVKVRHLKQ